MCITHDEAWSVACRDGSMRLSPTAAHALREAVRQMDLLVQAPDSPEALRYLTGMLVQLRTLRQSMA